MDYSTSSPFGDRLRRNRPAAGLTQEELAERTTLSEGEFEVAWAEGRAVTPEHAANYALEWGGA